VKAVSIHTSHSACQCIVLDVDGTAWMFGRNEHAVLGTPGDVISENAPTKVTPQSLGASKHTKFVSAAVGRNHTLLVSSEGQVWSCGMNNMGQVCKGIHYSHAQSLKTPLQCGHSVCPEIGKFKLIDGPTYGGNREKVIKAAVGLNFSLVLTESGKGATTCPSFNLSLSMYLSNL
jgi:alpha-tubulin suppressor-like RCC1 family protein